MSSAFMAITFSELLFGKSIPRFHKNSKVVIKSTNSVSIPRNMTTSVSRSAFHGWFSYIVSTEYEVYQMRRMVKVRTPDMKNAAKGKVKNDEHKSNLTSSTSEISDNDDQQLDQETQEHPDNREDDVNSKEESKIDMERDTWLGLTELMDDVDYGDDDDDNDDDGDLQLYQLDGHAESDMCLLEDDGEKVVQRDSDPKRRSIYYIYKVSNDRRQKLLQYAAFTAGHLGVFAFLFQVFDDRGAIMQICCYAQLVVLLLCFLLYASSYILDILIVLKIIYDAKSIECWTRQAYDIKRKGVKIYIHRIFAVSEFGVSQQQIQEKRRQFDLRMEELTDFFRSYDSYTPPILDILFAVSAMVIECLTIVYVYNNTQGNVQGQDDRLQQT
ncbi:hypothetical protein LRAMOSA05082 [Lichtheimia ramosa]|uniref:Uncharacterized protein n=1 Tax=Lichtheimia ramosa TaxID=688394 RepID=A0A077X100_9FUNG|nr:hypothetical protein LRAMOSA05082 [Lichtheimia ramosa]